MVSLFHPIPPLSLAEDPGLRNPSSSSISYKAGWGIVHLRKAEQPRRAQKRIGEYAGWKLLSHPQEMTGQISHKKKMRIIGQTNYSGTNFKGNVPVSIIEIVHAGFFIL